ALMDYLPPLEKAEKAAERAKTEYEEIKAYKDKVAAQIKMLEDLFKQADTFVQSSNYSVVAAYFLESENYFNESLPTADWLKNELTSKLKAWIQSEKARFEQHLASLNEAAHLAELKQQVTNAKEEYESFKANRRDQFILEAQYIE
ncbi:MAG: hypothetical protein F6J97_24220, partial [Leptolyngbya sp. SIO4C1]|nr:hypothetical protein [Leptolyngbya sp. SIO4C1]